MKAMSRMSAMKATKATFKKATVKTNKSAEKAAPEAKNVYDGPYIMRKVWKIRSGCWQLRGLHIDLAIRGGVVREEWLRTKE